MPTSIDVENRSSTIEWLFRSIGTGRAHPSPRPCPAGFADPIARPRHHNPWPQTTSKYRRHIAGVHCPSWMLRVLPQGRSEARLLSKRAFRPLGYPLERNQTLDDQVSFNQWFIFPPRVNGKFKQYCKSFSNLTSLDKVNIPIMDEPAQDVQVKVATRGN